MEFSRYNQRSKERLVSMIVFFLLAVTSAWQVGLLFSRNITLEKRLSTMTREACAHPPHSDTFYLYYQIENTAKLPEGNHPPIAWVVWTSDELFDKEAPTDTRTFNEAFAKQLEDSLKTIKTYKMRLKKVRETTDLIKFASTHPVFIIITDMRTTNSNDYKSLLLLSELRNRKMNIPLIILSSNDDPEAIRLTKKNNLTMSNNPQEIIDSVMNKVRLVKTSISKRSI